MPYINQERRDELTTIENDEMKYPHTAGELNFEITDLLIGYIRSMGLSYGVINDCLGALEGAKLEFYRRVAMPYENKKRDENGDVYPAFTRG